MCREVDYDRVFGTACYVRSEDQRCIFLVHQRTYSEESFTDRPQLPVESDERDEDDMER